MIKQTSLDFLSKLKKNNSKDWFEQNRDLYEHYKTDILELTENLLTGLSQFDQSIELFFFNFERKSSEVCLIIAFA